MTRPSLRRAIDAKCRDCGGQEGGERHWRGHCSFCPVIGCALWPVRPITGENPPEWLTSRDPSRLPQGFLQLSTEEALALIRGAAAVIRPVKGGNSATMKPNGRGVGDSGDDDLS